MVYHITNLPPKAADGKIFTAANAEGYVESGEVHLKDATAHYIHKPNATPPGWYMRNRKTGQDCYLGEGASPTISVEVTSVENETLWTAIATENQPEDETPDEEG